MSRFAFFSLWVLIFVIPFENMLVFPGFGTISRAIGVVAIVSGGWAFILERREIFFSRFQIIFSVFILFSMTSFFWSIDPYKSITSIVSLIQLFAFVWLIFEFGKGSSRQLKLLSAYVLGAFVSSISTILAFLHGSESFYLRYSAKGFDPNDLGVILSFAIPLSWYVSTKSKHIIFKVLFKLYIPFAFYSVILTSSRAAFITLIVSCSFILWVHSEIKIHAKVVAFICIVLLGFYAIEFLPDSSFERIMTIPTEISSGSLNSRTDIWRQYLYIFSNDPVLGVGVGSTPEALSIKTGVWDSTHNLFLTWLVELGVSGFLIFMILFFEVLRNLCKLEKAYFKLWFVVGMVWFIGVMSLNWELKKTTWFMFGMITVSSHLHLRSNNRVPNHEQELENSTYVHEPWLDKA